MTKKIILSIALIMGVVLFTLLWLLSPQKPELVTTANVSQKNPVQGSVPVSENKNNQPLTEKQKQYIAVGNQIKSRYAGRLDNPYWRVKLINDLMQIFKKEYPNNWLSELEAFIRHAFPDIAEDLLNKLHALIEYNNWLENLKSTMQFASLKERQAALWDKRLALFGEEAYVIWEAALKNEQLQEKLAQVDEFVGSFTEKAQLYRDSMQEIFGPDVIGENAPHKTQVLSKFLELESVQNQLHSMPEDKRYQELRNFRKSLGMDEEALQRWDKLDQERIQMWSNAETYMAERANLEAQYQGEELEQKIHQLQDELFGETEAKYIRNEERSGYYRFKNPQKIGLN